MTSRRERNRRDFGATEVTVTLTIDEAIAMNGCMEFASGFADQIAGEGWGETIDSAIGKLSASYSPLLQEFMRNLDISGIAEEAFGEEPAGKETE